ncbi:MULTISPECIES: hypothetical protein [Methylococcus]|jgi:hypothetical protein|uniref:hypothetical protein n=1 Tax=Methylococcus TaxID=413 RepID=UPI001C528BBD|nr:hypothetical protein [Methylococcus capsulatus]QXP92546.1 hypothetical protein KW113_09065 [Methylococcus capsulatus]
MPQLIQHIDAIAREKKRGVLYLTFHPDSAHGFRLESERNYEYRHDAVRQRVLAWLEEHGYTWQPCGDFANENSLRAYRGQIYIDIPLDESDQRYCFLRDFLENPDGSMRQPQVEFWYLSLESAMKNAHHDEPGFWERWAETF